MATPFRVGKRVLCIDGTSRSRSTDPFRSEEIKKPRKGQVYTIREIIDTGYGIGLRLVEIENMSYHHTRGGMQEPCFSTDRFKVLDDETAAHKITGALIARAKKPRGKKKATAT